MITIDSLVKRYGDFTAVDGISLQALPGAVFGFLGPNGAGKTTTIRILAGLSLPTSGRATIGGIDIVDEPEKAKAMTGFIPDRPYLYEKLTGRELLHFVADLYHTDWADAERRSIELLDYLQLREWVDARIENYSHGMKQKLVLAAALVHDPKILIIDEPMVGLDALAQRQVKLLLRQKAAAGCTVFLTTHTMSVAEAVCDEIAILHRGRIAAEGSPEKIRQAAGSAGGVLEDAFLAITYDDAAHP